MNYEKILIFGDSITWGADDSDGLGWANRYRKSLESQGFDISVYNLGIRGDTTAGLLRRFEVETDIIKPTNICIVFAIGTNDSRLVNNIETPEIPLEQFKSNIEQLISLAEKFTKNIVFVGLTNVIPNRITLRRVDKDYIYTDDRIKAYNQVIERASQQHGYKFINLQNLFKLKDLSEDGLHPNSRGHIKMFEEISKHI